MKVLISGSTGLIGSGLVDSLEADGHAVGRLVRCAPQAPNEVRWDPAAGEIDREGLAGFDGVVHLAGENIAAGRWTAAQKRRVRDSRVDGTRLLCEALAGLEARPACLVCASAMGYYGNRGDEVLTEESAAGTGFLAETCVGWEAAAAPVHHSGIRLVQLRIGIVLSRKGGALKRMLTPFTLGLGGRLGSGRQHMSWISLTDMVRIIRRALDDEGMVGTYNAVGPDPATNAAFTKTLGRVLRRPTLFPAPAFALRLMLGTEFANDLLLASVRVLPHRLLDERFVFEHPDLESALRSALENDKNVPG